MIFQRNDLRAANFQDLENKVVILQDPQNAGVVASLEFPETQA
jgi:hypothetical protein